MRGLMRRFWGWTSWCFLAWTMASIAQGQDSQTLQPQVIESVAKDEASVAGGAGIALVECRNGINRRNLRLVSGRPCEVRYQKETEAPGHDQVLWTAKNDPAYCEAKVKAFVLKLKELGWACKD